MDRAALERLLTAVDDHLDEPATMVVYGAAAFMLLGEELRTSIDVDVAGPYCSGNIANLRRAIEKAGYAINPPPHLNQDHIEWVSVERLSLEPPDEQALSLWRGRYLHVITVSPAALIASKLIRYDATDQSDIRTLGFRMNVSWEHVKDAVKRLPPTFRDDAIVQENLENLKRDMMLWRSMP
ncbi:MAG TPA: hypothetical protein PKE26_08605 [Kiritimatiellia bacterium]|nr:hypothetical protein [Kiritimatiellia bacterium]HMO99155.1 hypothetical protein [Kiritimatiellia bacterium]HMP95667.1 hypothetical protein [Kiritimatiellia bacterium]